MRSFFFDETFSSVLINVGQRLVPLFSDFINLFQSSKEYRRTLANSVDLWQRTKVEDTLQNVYSKACVKRPLKKRQNKDLNDKW